MFRPYDRHVMWQGAPRVLEYVKLCACAVGEHLARLFNATFSANPAAVMFIQSTCGVGRLSNPSWYCVEEVSTWSVNTTSLSSQGRIRIALQQIFDFSA